MEVLVVDDVRLPRQTLAAMLRKAFPDITVHLESDLRGALSLAYDLVKLDLVLLDLGLPDSAGINTLQRFRAHFPRVKVVVVSVEEDPATMRAAFRSGAVGFIPKSTEPALIVKVLQLVIAGGIYFPVEALDK